MTGPEEILTGTRAIVASTELRREPRFEVDLPAEAQVLAPADAYAEGVRVKNLSQSGLQLVCGPALVSALSPKDRSLSSRLPAELAVHFDLDHFDLGITHSNSLGVEQPQAVSLTCRLVYTRRLKAGRFLLGCNLSGLQGDSEFLLEAYLRQLAART